MRIKQLGRTGMRVSVICLGTMTFGNQADQETSFAIMDVADEAGVTFFDTADVYPLGSDLSMVGATEEIVGAWLPCPGAGESSANAPEGVIPIFRPEQHCAW